MCNMADILYIAGTAYPLRAHVFMHVCGMFRVAHLYKFLCHVFYFVCLRPVSCVPNVASISGLSVLDCLLRFSLTFI